MPFNYTITTQEKSVYVKAIQVIDAQSAIEAVQELVQDPDFDFSYDIVVDLRQMKYEPNLADLGTIRDGVKQYKSKFIGEIIVIVRSKDFLKAQLAASLAKTWELNVKAVTSFRGK